MARSVSNRDAGPSRNGSRIGSERRPSQGAWQGRCPVAHCRDIIADMSTSPRRTSFPGLDRLSDRRRALVDELAAARRRQGLSQTEIAARMGTSQSAVARFERGDLDPRLSTLERYAQAVGQTVDWQIRTPPETT